MSTRAEIEQEICNLTSKLTSAVSSVGDWKVAKVQEYLLAGLESPYDINELHVKRQAVRDQINALQEELKNAPVEEVEE